VFVRSAIKAGVRPGDIIIARGDVLHTTQDQDTDRIALTLRAVAGQRTVNKKTFLGLSPYARRRLTAPKPAFPFFAAKFLGALEMQAVQHATIVLESPPGNAVRRAADQRGRGVHQA